MSPEDRKTGYVCKPRSKYTRLHSRIERERQKEFDPTFYNGKLQPSIKIKSRSLFRRGGKKTRRKKSKTKRKKNLKCTQKKINYRFV